MEVEVELIVQNVYGCLHILTIRRCGSSTKINKACFVFFFFFTLLLFYTNGVQISLKCILYTRTVGVAPSNYKNRVKIVLHAAGLKINVEVPCF